MKKEQILISDNFTYRKLFKFVLPSIVMMVVISIYGVVDGLFVSNFVGQTAFASLNLVMPFVMIIGGTGFMIGTGGTALVAKILGEGDREKANKTFTMMVLFTIILGVVLAIVGVAVMRPVVKFLGATEDMVEYCVLYGRIVVGFTVFYMLQSLFQNFLVVAEKPNLGLLITVIAGLTNGVFDAIFIVAFKWGIAGAAIATGLGQVVGTVIPIIYFAKKKDCLLTFSKTKLEAKPIISSCANGSSELLTNVSSSIVGMLYNKQLMKFYGENGVSAYGIIMYVQFIFLAIIIGYSIGSAPIVGYNLGAKNTTELKNIFKKSMIILSIAGVVLAGLAEALALPLAKLFVGYNAELTDLTVHAFRITSIAFIFSGITVYSSGFFTALNDGLISAILSVLRSLIFQISYIFLLPYLFGHDAIWWVMCATELSAFVVAVIFFATKKKKYQYA